MNEVKERRIGLGESLRILFRNMLGSEEFELAFEDMKEMNAEDKKECLKAMKTVDNMANKIGSGSSKGKTAKRTPKISIQHDKIQTKQERARDDNEMER